MIDNYLSKMETAFYSLLQQQIFLYSVPDNVHCRPNNFCTARVIKVGSKYSKVAMRYGAMRYNVQKRFEIREKNNLQSCSAS